MYWRKKIMAKKKRVIKVNMDGVNTGMGTVPEGEYLVKVANAEVKTSSNNNEYIAFQFEVVEGKHKKAKLFHNCSLVPAALFNLKSVLVALGYEMDSVEFDLDLDDLIDMECLVEVEHEVYEGKKKARIVEFSPAEDDDEDDEPDDEDDEPDDEDDEDDEDDDDEDDDDEDDDEPDYEDMDIKELKALAKERGIKVKKKMDKDDIIELLEEDDLPF
jgi:Protein of unknown function (DUF669).